MALPIAGAVGTLFVWCAANLYVGDVEVVTDQPTPDLVVNVYNQKGQATNYHVNKFQLMPGSYHIEILPDGKTKIPANIEVNFHSVNRLVVHAPSSGKFNSLHLSTSGAPIPTTSTGKTTTEQDIEVTTQNIQPLNADVSLNRPSEQEVLPPSTEDINASNKANNVAKSPDSSTDGIVPADASSKDTKSTAVNTASAKDSKSHAQNTTTSTVTKDAKQSTAFSASGEAEQTDDQPAHWWQRLHKKQESPQQ